MKHRIFILFIVYCCLVISCNVIFNITLAGLLIKQGGQNILNTTGQFNFGEVFVGSSSTEIIFTIENQSKIVVNLTGSPIIQLSGTNLSEFEVDTIATNTEIEAGNSTTFAITFIPSSVGEKSATVSIANDSKSQNPYTFNISGTAKAVVYAPEINVKQGANNISFTTGVYEFGNTSVGSSSPAIVFTVENLGNADLILTSEPDLIQKTGGDSTLFAINQSTTISTINPMLVTFFSIYFNPYSIGSKSTTIVIPNNDSNENPYTFTVRGTATAPSNAPEINVRQDTYNIACTTGSFNFGSVYINESSTEFEFTIENLGSADLTLSGIPKVGISGSNAAMFIMNQTFTTSPVSPGNSTSWTITFKPTSEGLLTASISIQNNDTSENPYVFEIAGTGTQTGIAYGWIGGGSAGWKTNPGTNPANDYQSFRNPSGVFVDLSGYIYVAEFSSNRISKWSSTGNPIGWIGGGSNGWKTRGGATADSDLRSFRNPRSVFVDSAGNIYVADSNNHRISKWTNTGDAIGWFGGGSNGWRTDSGAVSDNTYNSFYNPDGLFVNSAGYIFVADTGNHRICKWDSLGNPIGWIGGGSSGWKTGVPPTYGSNNYQSFLFPRGVSVDTEGNIFVADNQNHRISRWSSSGTAQGWIGDSRTGWNMRNGANIGSDYQSFSAPTALFIDSRNYIYIADQGNHRICKWNNSGTAIGWLGGASNGWKTTLGTLSNNDYQSFNSPFGIYVDSTGFIYIGDRSNHRVSKWRD